MREEEGRGADDGRSKEDEEDDDAGWIGLKENG